jgi:copper chaperone CopZ
MSNYIHHISGRLRLNLAQIKRQPARAQEVQAAIWRINGVTSVEPNITTGSLLIRYDTAKVEVGTILHSMKEAGLLSAPSAPDRTSAQHRPIASPVADKVVDMLVGKLIERSAVAILGVLL